MTYMVIGIVILKEFCLIYLDLALHMYEDNTIQYRLSVAAAILWDNAYRYLQIRTWRKSVIVYNKTNSKYSL